MLNKAEIVCKSQSGVLTVTEIFPLCINVSSKEHVRSVQFIVRPVPAAGMAQFWHRPATVVYNSRPACPL
jgi:hypothetical protein